MDIDPSYHYLINSMSNLAFLSNNNNGERVFEMINNYKVIGNERIVPSGDSYFFIVEATNTTDYCFKEFSLYLGIYDDNYEYFDSCETIIDEWKPEETIEISFEVFSPIEKNYFNLIGFDYLGYFITKESYQRVLDTWA